MNKINQVFYYNFICDTSEFDSELRKIVSSLPLERSREILSTWDSIKPMILKLETRDKIFQFTERFIKEYDIKAEVDRFFKEKMGNS